MDEFAMSIKTSVETVPDFERVKLRDNSNS